MRYEIKLTECYGNKTDGKRNMSRHWENIKNYINQISKQYQAKMI